MSDNTAALQRAQLFEQLCALFDFDAQGVLPCLAPGMSGPIGIPVGYLDLTSVSLNGKALGGWLLLSWQGEKIGQFVPVAANSQTSPEPRDATNEELQCALEHYKHAVEKYREDVVQQFKLAGQELSRRHKAQLGMAPYFASADA